MPITTNKLNTPLPRPPVVVIMGHVDHGKSTLLDYIRKSEICAGESGGITQHMGAYEVVHAGKHITFLDTPGHEAFSSMRSRGARVADIAVLVVAADDGVKAQTLEALKEIEGQKLPFIVAINKIDRTEASIDRTKQQLSENGIFVEGYGGTVSCVSISAKSGSGVNELLETILLVAEVEEFTATPEAPATGLVIESRLDTRKGIMATLIVKDGTLHKGEFVIIDHTVSSVRQMENSIGLPVEMAGPSSSVRLSGLVDLPKVGSEFKTFKKKKDAESFLENLPIKECCAKTTQDENGKLLIPVVVKADTAGTLEAIEKELCKLEQETIGLRLVVRGVGTVGEADVKAVLGAETPPLIVGFRVKIDPSAADLAERNNIFPQTFDVIYKLSEWLEKIVAERRPIVTKEVVEGKVKVLKIFSQTKNRQVIGGQVLEGIVSTGKMFNIIRRDETISQGKVINLEQSRQKVDMVENGKQFGAITESKIPVAEGDRLDTIGVISK